MYGTEIIYSFPNDKNNFTPFKNLIAKLVSSVTFFSVWVNFFLIHSKLYKFIVIFQKKSYEYIQHIIFRKNQSYKISLH